MSDPTTSRDSVLVIGHGYIGSALAESLSREGVRVTAVNRTSSERSSYPVLGADVSDRASVASLRRSLADRPPGLVVHCASSGRGGAEAYRAVFLNGIGHLVDAFPGVPLLFTSSTSVYGQTDGSEVDENSPTEPERETSRILVEAEERVRATGGVALRLAGIYGPGRSIYLQRLFEGTATIEGGEVSRFVNQIHRDDAVGAISHLVRNGFTDTGGRVFNVVDDTPLTQREVFERLAFRFGVALPPVVAPDKNRKRAWTHKSVSNGALRATGWRPLYPSFFDAVERDPELVPSIRDAITRSRD